MKLSTMLKISVLRAYINGDPIQDPNTGENRVYKATDVEKDEARKRIEQLRAGG